MQSRWGKNSSPLDVSFPPLLQATHTLVSYPILASHGNTAPVFARQGSTSKQSRASTAPIFTKQGKHETPPVFARQGSMTTVLAKPGNTTMVPCTRSCPVVKWLPLCGYPCGCPCGAAAVDPSAAVMELCGRLPHPSL